MDISTGREFAHPNPQDDPGLFARPPPGFGYRVDGSLVGIPGRSKETIPETRDSSIVMDSSITMHVGVGCDHCGMVPIRGRRYKCEVCDDYDVCEICNNACAHDSTHPMTQYKTPRVAVSS